MKQMKMENENSNEELFAMEPDNFQIKNTHSIQEKIQDFGKLAELFQKMPDMTNFVFHMKTCDTFSLKLLKK